MNKLPSIWALLWVGFCRPFRIPFLIRLVRDHKRALAEADSPNEILRAKLHSYGWSEEQIKDVMKVIVAGGEFEPDHFERWNE